ncbi:MAG: hypothetical protein FVQ81_05165 [Candidatus Glassbacteria bacterium]|nr:hypothetical protein [Candidatus Glassbacteria bacterium]
MPTICSGAKPAAKHLGTIALLALLLCLLFAVPAFAQDQPVVVSNVKVEPNPFSPNNDGVNETTKFSFTLTEASAVTIELVWFSNPVVVDGVTLHSGPLNDTLRLGDSDVPFASDMIYLDSAAVSGLNEYIWDGMLGALQVPDSTYTYLIRAEDLDADDQFTTQPVTGTLQIDSNPPVISSVGVSPNPFSPNGDKINDEANITFTLSGLPNNAKVGDIAFSISYDNEGNPISFNLDTGNTTDEFLNSDTLDVPFAPIKLQFIPKNLNIESISFVIQGGRVLDSGDTVAVSSNVEIPGHDQDNPADRSVTSLVKFSFIDKVFNEDGSRNDNPSNLVEVRTFAGNVRVEVNNSSNEQVASYLELDPPFIGNGSYTASLATELPDDTYTFIITAVDESGNLARQTGQVTAISEAFAISGLVASPDTISPADQNNRLDLTTISYTINRAGTVTLQIFRDSTAFVQNNLVRTLYSNREQQEGSHNISWDGKNDVGEFVSQNLEQNYRVILSVFDPITFETTESRTLVRVDNAPPEEVFLSPLPRRTNQGTLAVDGRASANDSVIIYLNSEIQTITEAGSTGVFTIQLVLGGDGIKRIFAHSFDRVGNGPTVSDTQAVILDTQPPVAVDTVIRSGGERISLIGTLLTSFGPSDTLELVLSDTSGAATGVELSKTSLRVAGPSGREISGSVLLVEPDTVRFVPATEQTALGTDTLIATFADSLGNQGSLRVVFNLGQARPAPSLDSLSVNLSRGGYLNSLLDLSQSGSQWIFTAHITDHSGTGLDSAASTVAMINRSTQDIIEGDWRVVNGNIEYTVTQNIATDGSMDGWFVLVMVVNDDDPATATLVGSDSLFNDTRRPDTLSVTADSARVAVTLRDIIPGSGVSLLQSRIDVPAVASQQKSFTNDGDSTLFVEFDPPLGAAGIYSIDITVFDRAGNSRQLTRQFAIGGEQVRPRVVAASEPYGGPVRTEDITQPLRSWVLLEDVAGAGIDWDATAITLLSPDSSALEGTVARTGDTLALTLDGLISNSGEADGRYSLNVHAVDVLGGELDTTLSFILDNVAPDTVAVVFVGDSSTIRVSVTDRPAVEGTDSSGVVILSASAAMSGPDGQPVQFVTNYDGSNTLIITIVGGKPQAAGIYILSLSILDAAGNSRTVQIPFPLNVTGILTVFPPDSSIVSGGLSAVVVWADGLPEDEAAGSGSTIRVTRNGVLAGGTSTVVGDSLVFTFSDTLAVDGTDDGLYAVEAFYDAASLGQQRDVNTIFTNDNLPPDTVSVAVDPSAGGTLVTVALTDGGSYPQVAGIDRDATSAVVIDPSGREFSPLSRRWLDETTIEYSLAAFSQGGLHKLRLTATDLAGQSALFSIPVVNNEGTGSGASTAYVEEVPARTSAHISFVSGRGGTTITRAILRIFNLRGDLVRRIDATGRIGSNGNQVSAEWLLANDGGKYVNNGVFIYYWEVTFSDGRTERIRKTLAVARR